MDHGVLERPQEVLLEFEVRQLLLLQEAHRELPQRVQGEEAHVWVLVTTDLEGRISHVIAP